MIEVADVRRRLRQRIEEARRAAAARRAAIDAAEVEYERFLKDVAAPVFRMFASALSAEGYPYKVFTPAGMLRLASERSRQDYVEVELDTDSSPPQVTGRSNRSHGARVITAERPVRDGAGVGDLTEGDVLEFLLAEIGPFVER